MFTFLTGRVIQSGTVLAVMSFVIYWLMGLMPGDPIDLMISANPKLTSEDASRLRALHGLDVPVVERYWYWLTAALGGDFGYSRLHAKPVLGVIIPALGNTIILMGLSFVFSILIAIPVGVIAAVRQNTRLDYVINLFSFLAISVPSFWLALLMITLFSVTFGLLPAGGTETIGIDSLADKAKFLVLPVATLTLLSFGSQARFTRAEMIQTLRQDYIRTARAKGVPESRVIFRHALRNALIPVVTIIALDFGYLFSGALTIEIVFAFPGMGKLIFDAIMGNDFNLAMVALLFATAMTLAGNLLADLAYGALDPRIAYGTRAL
ncbi:MAG: diguanylate cyclase [Rhodospirillaceae bacterium TMED167]|nr:diguanylate cyclase [Rhodospirillaceae bacterium]OUW28449.1 MAG: diguanylate cyclase [Rhodospirillaceae bacterium TMED167]